MARPTDEWQDLLPLFEWPEQQAYEELRPLVLFGVSERPRRRWLALLGCYARASSMAAPSRRSRMPQNSAYERATTLFRM